MILVLYSIVALTAEQLVPQDSLMTRHAAWYAIDSPTFSDTIALVRRSLWSEGIYGRLGNRGDMVKIPRALFDRPTELSATRRRWTKSSLVLSVKHDNLTNGYPECTLSL